MSGEHVGREALGRLVRVVLSEAVGLAGELGRGWRAVHLRGGRKSEWVTLYGTAPGVEHGRLFAGGAA